jgi:hypothetical protein
MTDAAYEAVLAEQSRASLHFFTRRMFKARKGFRWVNNWHHEAICRALMRVFKGECTTADHQRAAAVLQDRDRGHQLHRLVAGSLSRRRVHPHELLGHAG